LLSFIFEDFSVAIGRLRDQSPVSPPPHTHTKKSKKKTPSKPETLFNAAMDRPKREAERERDSVAEWDSTSAHTELHVRVCASCVLALMEIGFMHVGFCLFLQF